MNSSRTDATFLHRMFRSWRFPAHHFVRWVIPTLRGTLFCAFSGALLFMHGQVALAQTEKVLYSFCAKFNCADGSDPVGSLILDGQGECLWNNRSRGHCCSLCQSFGCGTVFEWTASGTLKTLITSPPPLTAKTRWAVWLGTRKAISTEQPRTEENGCGVVFELTERACC